MICKSKTPAMAGVFIDFVSVFRLLAVLLNARGAQASEAMLVDRILPGKKLFDGQRVARARFLKREKAAAHRGHHLCLAADDPALRTRSGKVRDRKRASVGKPSC